MMDRFVLITQGAKDSRDKAVVRLSPTCYTVIANLKKRTGLSMRSILEQCVEFALEHMDFTYEED